MKKNDCLTLSIQRLNEKGHGTARLNERKIAIPYALPNEKIEAVLLRKQRAVWEARLETVIEKSPSRLPFKCAHAGKCGGCQLQHWDYSAQLQQKEEWIRELFLDFSPDHFFAIIGCESPWNYRNKMEYTFSESREGEKFLGLLRQGSQRVENIEGCDLAPVWFSKCLNAVRQWWRERGYSAFHPRRGEGLLRNLTLRQAVHTQERMVILTIHKDPSEEFSIADRNPFLEALKEFLVNATVILKTHIAQKGQPTRWDEELLFGKGYLIEEMGIGKAGRLKFKISPDAFFQPNPIQAQKLFERALELADIGPHESVLDLYSGTGVLSLVASLRAKSVIGIELNASAVKDAGENILLNDIANVTTINGDVGRVLKERNWSTNSFQTVIVDPPRSGLTPDAIEQILSLSPQKIVYISCNPRTQALNVKVFLENGYQIGAIQPVDQFPHTYHIENIVILYKKSPF